MNARHVARELFVLALSQRRILEKDLNKANLKDFLEQSIRTITNEISSLIEESKSYLLNADNFLYEAKLLDNKEKVFSLLEKSYNNLAKSLEMINYFYDWPLQFSISLRDDVQDFCVRLLRVFKKNKKEIESIIDNSLSDWSLETLYSIDRNILFLAVTEIAFLKNNPKIAIDEAVEIAKKYGSNESSSFVNGVLRRVIKKLGIDEELEKDTSNELV
ncbi:MAG: N utilization substance protein B [Candidatus Sericytochromatia bacterium]|nr:MAG: N utilization substance protein B [Candidatus Sericytochromatia bacterium]